jgi:hypothetical protein
LGPPSDSSGRSEYDDESYWDGRSGEMEGDLGSELYTSDITSSFQSAATARSIPRKAKAPPSSMAQSLVQDLGVEGPEAVTAMKVLYTQFNAHINRVIVIVFNYVYIYR